MVNTSTVAYRFIHGEPGLQLPQSTTGTDDVWEGTLSQAHCRETPAGSLVQVYTALPSGTAKAWVSRLTTGLTKAWEACQGVLTTQCSCDLAWVLRHPADPRAPRAKSHRVLCRRRLTCLSRLLHSGNHPLIHRLHRHCSCRSITALANLCLISRCKRTQSL